MSDAEPALTDAFVEVGLIGDDQSLGGKIAVRAELAHAALAALGRDRAWSAGEIASGAIDIAVARMVAEATRVLARRGIDAPQFRMVAFGGAGPLLAALVCAEIGVGDILVPHRPGALSAFGAAYADIEGDLLLPVYCKASELTAGELGGFAARLSADVAKWVETQREAAEIVATVVRLGCDMRYDGQGFDVAVPVDGGVLERGDVPAVVAAFHAAHRGAFGHADERAEVWVKELRAHVVCAIAKPEVSGFVEADLLDLPLSRALELGGVRGDVPVIARGRLSPGDELEGPLVIEQLDATTYVPPRWRLSCHESRHLVLSYLAG